MTNGALKADQPGTASRARYNSRLRADQRPLYVQASDALRQLVHSGGYAPGARLPSEIELSERLGISRPTLREALHMLEEEGTILRRHGVGTFVAQAVPVIEGGLEVLESIERMAERCGLSTRMVEASIVERTATPNELRGLAAAEDNASAAAPAPTTAPAPGASVTGVTKVTPVTEATPAIGVTVVTRVIVADGQRVAFLTDVVPQDQLRAAELGKGFHGSVLDLFLQRGWPQLAHSRTELAAEAADGDLARRLHLQRGAPLLKLEAQLYAQDGRVVRLLAQLLRARLLPISRSQTGRLDPAESITNIYLPSRRILHMRSFMGRDILSLKDFERQEFFRVFEIARTRWSRSPATAATATCCKEKTMVTAFYQPSHPHPPGPRGRHAPPGRPRDRLLRRQDDPRRRLVPGDPSRTPSRCWSSTAT